MTDDTSQPPAPRPGWVATVTLEYYSRTRDAHQAKLPSGGLAHLRPHDVASLDWQPPPPPPWEPEVGGRAEYCSQKVTIRAIDGQEAWARAVDTTVNFTVNVSDLSPPKGGA